MIRGNLPGTPVKPDPGVARGILEKLNARPEETLMVGDSDVDIRTGHNAGLKACGVTWGFRSRENLVNAGADFLADTPAELEKLLMNWKIEAVPQGAASIFLLSEKVVRGGLNALKSA